MYDRLWVNNWERNKRTFLARLFSLWSYACLSERSNGLHVSRGPQFAHNWAYSNSGVKTKSVSALHYFFVVFSFFNFAEDRRYKHILSIWEYCLEDSAVRISRNMYKIWIKIYDQFSIMFFSVKLKAVKSNIEYVFYILCIVPTISINYCFVGYNSMCFRVIAKNVSIFYFYFDLFFH